MSRGRWTLACAALHQKVGQWMFCWFEYGTFLLMQAPCEFGFWERFPNNCFTCGHCCPFNCHKEAKNQFSWRLHESKMCLSSPSGSIIWIMHPILNKYFTGEKPGHEFHFGACEERTKEQERRAELSVSPHWAQPTLQHGYRPHKGSGKGSGFPSGLVCEIQSAFSFSKHTSCLEQLKAA